MNYRTLVSVALAALLSLSSLPAAFAGEGRAEISIDALREQIRGLEAAAREASATPEVAGLNAEFLNEKRRELARLLATRRAALRSYLASAGPALNEREGARVRQAIEKIDAEIASLETSLPAAAAATSKVAAAPSVAPAETPRAGAGKFANADANAERAARAGGLAKWRAQDAAAADDPQAAQRFEQKKQRAFDACSRCKSPEGAFMIDARANVAAEQLVMGETRTKVQRTRFRKGDHVNVSVYNMNPFLYKYTVRVAGRPVVETEHKQFLEALGGPLFGDLDGDGKTTGRGGGPAARGPVLLLREAGDDLAARAACPGDADASEGLKYIVSLQQRLMEAEKRLDDDFAYLLKKVKAAEGQYMKTHRALYDPHATCVELCQASAEYAVYMEENPLPTMLDAFDNEMAGVRELTEELDSALAEFDKEKCKLKVKGFDYYKSLATYRERVDTQLTSYGTRIEAWRDEEDQYFRALDDQIASVVAHPDQTLRQEFLIGDYETATDVTITLSWEEVTNKAQALSRRRPAGDGSGGDTADASGNGSRDTLPANDVTSVDAPGYSRRAGEARDVDTSVRRDFNRKTAELNFGGGPRFVVSAGLVYSPFPKREYGKVQGFLRDAQGNLIEGQEAPTDIIGIKEESKSRVTPLLMMSTRLTDLRDNNIFFSLGITARLESGNTKVEYLVGPSVNLFDRRLFLTAGGYAGRENVLAGDSFVGGKFVTDDNLTREQFRWRPGFSLTYRLNFFGTDEDGKKAQP